MTKDDFINKNFELIVQYYMDEGRSLDYEEDELYDYAYDTVCFTFVGTQQEVDDELKGRDYAVIAQEGDMLAVETFHGTMYDDIVL